MKSLSLILALLFTIPALAKAKVPLMPSRANPYRQASYRAPEKNVPRTRYSSPQRYYYFRDMAQETQLGFELGLAGRKQNSDGFLGMNLAMGGRILMEFPIFKKYRLRPSVGYFTSSSGEAGVTVSEHTIEGGLGFFMPLGRPKKARFQVGVMQRVDMSLSRIDVLTSTGSSGFGFAYRVGPALGLSVQMGNRSAFIVDLETTFAVTHNFRFHSGLTAGFLFTVD